MRQDLRKTSTGAGVGILESFDRSLLRKTSAKRFPEYQRIIRLLRSRLSRLTNSQSELVSRSYSPSGTRSARNVGV